MLTGIHSYEAFLVAALIFAMTPGLDTAFVLNKALACGRRAALVSAVGINAGVLVHAALGALGLSVILAQSAAAFAAVKWLGAAYLVWLGIRTLMTKPRNLSALSVEAQPESIWRSFRTAMVANVLNPKVALFVLAFFPQFIDAEAAGEVMPFMILGLTYAGIGLIWFLILAWGAAELGARLMKSPKAAGILDRVSGTVFILLGVKIAFAQQS